MYSQNMQILFKKIYCPILKMSTQANFEDKT